MKTKVYPKKQGPCEIKHLSCPMTIGLSASPPYLQHPRRCQMLNQSNHPGKMRASCRPNNRVISSLRRYDKVCWLGMKNVNLSLENTSSQATQASLVGTSFACFRGSCNSSNDSCVVTADVDIGLLTNL